MVDVQTRKAKALSPTSKSPCNQRTMQFRASKALRSTLNLELFIHDVRVRVELMPADSAVHELEVKS